MLTGIIDFAVYENGTEYLGLAKVGLPASQNKTININGAGFPGDMDMPIPGARTAQHVTIDFVDVQKSAYILAEERVHDLDLRGVHEEYDQKSGQIEKHLIKENLRVYPISRGGGDVAPASAQNVTNEFSLISRKEYFDGKLVDVYDPFNGDVRDATGKNIFADVNKLLGRS